MTSRIGVIVTALNGGIYAHDTVSALAKSPDTEVIVLYGTPDNHAARRSAAFSAIAAVEAQLVSRLKKSARAHFRSLNIELSAGVNRVELDVSAASPKPIEDLKKLDLDLIVSTIPNHILDPQVSAAAKLGVASLHFGMNTRNSSPPGFWEVYRRDAASIYAVMLQRPGHQTVEQLYAGNIATKRSFVENNVHLRKEGNPFLACVALEFLKAGEKWPTKTEGAPAAKAGAPSLSQTLAYAAKTFTLFAGLAIGRKILKRDQRWSVGFVRKHWQDADLSRAERIPNPKHCFLADPFVMARNGKHYIFVEDLDERRGLGAVSVAVIEPNGQQQFIANILVEPFHLSFPLVFEEEGEIFMMPETAESRTVRLYRCVEFPHRWELHRELMTDVSATDTMLIKRAGKWFMLTNLNQFGSADHLSQMHVLWANSLKAGEWHRTSPLPAVNSALDGRNGGLLQGKDGAFYRVRQRQDFNRYGAGLSIARITALDENHYAEELVREVKPDFLPGLVGTHHMHGNGDFTVFDFATIERYD